MPRTGHRKTRREALARAKKGGFLFICLGFKKKQDADSNFNTQIEYAVVTSKKSVSKRAVIRNKCKRRTRAALACLRDDSDFINLFNGFYDKLELLIVHQRDLSECSFVELKSHLSVGLLRLAENLKNQIRT
jgi:ribonuclease P protein component